jgi:hypothetical protein
MNKTKIEMKNHPYLNLVSSSWPKSISVNRINERVETRNSL